MVVRPVGYAIVGCGAIAQFHITAIQATSDAALIGVYDVRADSAQAVASSHGVLAFKSLEELIGHESVDVVIVCTPSGSRLPIAVAVANGGKNLLIEKPLEVTMERAQEIIDVAKANDVVLGCVFQYRFYPDVVQVKHLIESGKLGRLLLAEAQIKWHRSKDYYEASRWRGTWALDGGGVLMNQGIHTIDLMQWFMGPVGRVSGYTATLHHSIETEDTATASLQFESGALGTISATTATYPGLPAILSIHGTKGSVILTGEKLRYVSVDDPQVPEINRFEDFAHLSSGSKNPIDIAGFGHAQVIRDMTRAILDGRNPAIPGDEGIKSIEIISKIYESGNRMTGETQAV